MKWQTEMQFSFGKVMTGLAQRCLVGLVLIAFLRATLLAQTALADQTFKVTLLGTGAPGPSIERFGPSTLVEVGNQKLLFDVGRGATIRLNQVGVPLSDLTAVFVTHLHSDHVNGLSDLWLTGWLSVSGGPRKTPFRVFGPLGTSEMMSYLEKAHQADIRIRMADLPLPASGITVDATDVSEGVVYDREGVRVTVFDVDHGAAKPAFGYRVDYRRRSVVMSGDTRPSTNLAKYAQGATVVIHEVMAGAANPADEVMRTILALHSTPEQAGRIFADASPRLAVFSHIVLSGDSETELIRRTRTAYTGALEVGSDLMTIEVDDVPRVTRRNAAPQ
jgi:ribonuclease Z